MPPEEGLISDSSDIDPNESIPLALAAMPAAQGEIPGADHVSR